MKVCIGTENEKCDLTRETIKAPKDRADIMYPQYNHLLYEQKHSLFL